MTPNTQSVCKHCGQLCDPKKPKYHIDYRYDGHDAEPVAEPASTGEMPPKTVSLWPTCNFCGTELEKHPSGAGICPKCGAMKFAAARPSEPSATPRGFDPRPDLNWPLRSMRPAPPACVCKSEIGDNPACLRHYPGNSAPQTSAELQDDSELDGTDFSHPAWWRGNDYGVTVLCQKINAILDGEDDGRGLSSEPWETTRRRLIGLLKSKG